MSVFQQIPNGLKVPFMYVETRPGAKLPTSGGKRILLVGQRLSTGSVLAHVPTVITKASDAAGFFGKGSMLHRMALALFANWSLAEVYAIAVDDNGAGVASTGTIQITGAATGDGTLALYIAGQKLEIGVSSGDTVNTIAAAIEAELDANSDIPVTASVVTDTVTLTARHKGALGDEIDIRFNFAGELGGEVTPEGVTWTITAMSGGTTAPTLTSAIAAMADDPYEWVICPYTDTTSLDAWETEFARRWDATLMLYGHLFTAYNGTVAECSAAIGDATRNDAHASVWTYRGPAVSGGSPDPRAAGTPIGSTTPPWEWCAAHTAELAQSINNHPSQPAQGLKVAFVAAPPTLDQWTLNERNILLNDGCAVSTFVNGRVHIGRCVTTYQEDSFGEPDESYLDYNTLAQLSYVNRFVKAKVEGAFGRHILIDDGIKVGTGVDAVSPSDIRSEIVAAYLELAEFAVVENVEWFVENLEVYRDTDGNPAGDPNRVNVVFPGDLANQLRVVALANLFRLQAQ